MPLSALNKLETLWQETLAQQEQQGLRRQRFTPHPNATFVDFTSSDTMGHRMNSAVIAAGVANAQRYGAGNGAARMVVENDPTLDVLERTVSYNTGFAHTRFYPSGFMANLALFTALSPFEDEKNKTSYELFVDHRAHGSLMMGARLSQLPLYFFKHNDMAHLALQLQKSQAQVKLVVVEALHSMEGDFAPGCQLEEVFTNDPACVLIVDEAHSFGVYGPQGMGWIQQFPSLKARTLAVMWGCGKAVGVAGGLVSTHLESFAERLQQKSPVGLFSTAPSPFLTGAVLKSVELFLGEQGEASRFQLFARMDTLNKLLFKTCGLKQKEPSHIIPILVPNHHQVLALSQAMCEHGFLVRAYRPPTVPRGTARLRLSLKASHRVEELEKFVQCLVEQISILENTHV